MMNHLSPAEFVDAADHALPAGRDAHLAGCGRCREQLAAVRVALADAAAADAPEPSPLYWEHMAARIHAQVAGERIAPAGRQWFALRALVPIATGVALVAAVFVAGEMRGRQVAAPVPQPLVAATGSSAAQVDPDESEAWQVLASAAADIPIEEAHAAGMGVSAGAVDRAVQRMTPDELNELSHLLQTERHRSSD